MKLKIAQSISEYAILMSIVIAALIAINVYVTRGLQAKYKGVTDFAGDAVGIRQYEPYYADTKQTIDQEHDTVYVNEPNGKIEHWIYSNVTRKDANLTEGVNVDADNAWF